MAQHFRVGEWLVQPELNRISRRGETTHLDPQNMTLLVFLASRPGEVVRRDDLLDNVWEGTFVADSALSQAVSRLRRALGDDWRQPRYVETISKSGYRLVAPVEVVEETAAAGAGRRPASRPLIARVLWRPASLLTAIALAAVSLWGFLWVGAIDTVDSFRPLVARPAATLTGRQRLSRLAPDGTRMAFVWRGPELVDSHAPADDWDLYIQMIDSEDVLQLTNTPEAELYPAWSSDGRFLAFARLSADGCTIQRISSLGGAEVKLADCTAGIRWLDWSPDGNLLALADIYEGRLSIVVVDLATRSRRRVTVPPAESGGDDSPVFSRDGRLIAFTRDLASSREAVFTVPVEGGDATRQTFDRWGRIRGLDFSRDGDSIIFSSNRSGRYRLWEIPVAGGLPGRLVIEDEWVTEPSVAAGVDRLIYKTFRDTTNIYEVGLDPHRAVAGELRKVAPSTRSELHPQLAPDGQRIAFASDRSGTFEIYSSRLDGTEVIRHTRLEGPFPAVARWSPDGQTLLYSAPVDGHSDLFVVAADGDRPVRMTRDSNDELNGTFSADGRSIYFASNRSGSWQILKMPAAGGPPTVVTDGFLAVEDPEGRLLYILRLHEPGLWRRPVEGGQETFIGKGNLDDFENWVVRPGGIYFVQHNPTHVMFFDFRSGAARPVLRTPFQVPYLDLSLDVSASEERFFVVQIEQNDDEVMVVDLN